MAYTPITPVVTTLAGTDVAAAMTAPVTGAGTGDAVAVGAFLLIKNTAGAPLTVTIKASGNLLDGSATTDKTFTVASTSNALIGPLTNDMKQATGTSAGLVAVEYSAVTALRMWVTSPW